MSGTDENHVIHGVVVPEHLQKRAPIQTTAFKPWWRIVFMILYFQALHAIPSNSFQYLEKQQSTPYLEQSPF